MLLEHYPLATLARTRRASDLADAIEAEIANSRSLDPVEVTRIRAQFSSSTMARRYIQLYEGILHPSSPGNAAPG